MNKKATKTTANKKASAPKAAVAKNAKPPNDSVATSVKKMEETLAYQQKLQREQGPPSFKVRIDRLKRAEDLLKGNRENIVDALNEDFGNRSKLQSLFTDVFSTVDALKYARKNLRSWMTPQHKSANFPLNLLGARASIESIPYGTVGAIAPWNFPVYLTFTPLAGIFAAGNRAMLKPSEHAPASAELMRDMFASAFDESEVAVFCGSAEVSAAFSSLPFDHLIFTGGGSIAKHIVRAAAEHLTPLTLELGGKSPVVVGSDADMQLVANKVMFGKILNAGQICLAPDYLMLPKGKSGEFTEKSKGAIESMFPTLKDNDDYTGIINQNHYDRIQGLIEDAKQKGAEVVEINPADEDFSQQQHRKIPPTLILNPNEDMRVMQEEIFGPVLPVVEYDSLDGAVDRINDNDKPLGLYYFGKGSKERDAVLNRTSSGGVTVNDVMFHIAQHALPFGGVGPSGSGAYQGRAGFDNFSHQRAVFKQTTLIDPGKMFAPPHQEKQKKLLNRLIGN